MVGSRADWLRNLRVAGSRVDSLSKVLSNSSLSSSGVSLTVDYMRASRGDLR